MLGGAREVLGNIRAYFLALVGVLDGNGMRLGDYLLHQRGNDLAVRLIGVGVVDKVGVIVAYPPCLRQSFLFRLGVKLKIADECGQVGGSHVSRFLIIG